MKTQILAGVIVMGTGSVASAQALNLLLLPSPDIFSSFIQVDYDPGLTNLQLQADGFPIQYFDGSNTFNIASSMFMIDMDVDTSGNATGGTLSITGGIDDGDALTGAPGSPITLLEGSLDQFGWEMGSETLEFIFDVTGGALAGDYGSQAGVLLSDSGFDDDWTTAFSNTGNGQADIAPPVPAPGAILALGGLGVIAARRRR